MKTIELTDSNFENEVLKSDKIYLVDFSAEWCGPCKTMTPVIDQIAHQFNGTAFVGKLDVDTNPETTAQFEIRNLPTFLIFKNGKIVERIVGAVPISVLTNKIRGTAL